MEKNRKNTREEIDVSETLLRKNNSEAFEILLLDHSRAKDGKEEEKEKQRNIVWACTDYEEGKNGEKREGYGFYDKIEPEKITNDSTQKERGSIVMPRCCKSLEEKKRRVKEKAEVFTPSWVCNLQNNLVDRIWFFGDDKTGEDLFNTVSEDGRVWKKTQNKIDFTKTDDKTWRDYVSDRRLEICCGEGPYLCSRYDTTTGESIEDVFERVGILDRKLRVVSENCKKKEEWIRYAKKALKATYGYDFQGDNLLLAREAVLFTVRDFYKQKFKENILKKTADKKTKTTVREFAKIISWNLWQMDGLRNATPCSSGEESKGRECVVREWGEGQTFEETVWAVDEKVGQTQKEKGGEGQQLELF